jgi:hypothetical protein
MSSIYRFFDSDGVLLYVGKSVNPFNRFTQHGRYIKSGDVSSITIEHHPNSKDIESLEYLYIFFEKPEANIKIRFVEHLPHETMDSIFKNNPDIDYKSLMKIRRLAIRDFDSNDDDFAVIDGAINRSMGIEWKCAA